MSNKIDERTLGRELAFKYLYQVNILEKQSGEEFTHSNLDSNFDEFLTAYTEPDEEHPQNTLTPFSKSLAKTFISGVIQNKETLAALVQNHLGHRSFAKITSLEKCLLLISSYELSHRKDTPAKVVINEAVNLSKKYGEKDSFAFVNGVLNSLSKDI